MPPELTIELNISQARAASRFHQIARLERAICLKLTEIADCKEHLKALNEEYQGALLLLRAAARDEGELPLFDLLEGE